MLNSYVLNETFVNGLSYNFLYVIFILSIISSVFVIVSKNPIVSVLFLIGLFVSIASYLIMTGVSFIGLSYLLVYVGAVSILFLFILMLINVRGSELLTDNNNSIPLALIIGVSFNITYNTLLPYNNNLISNKEKTSIYEISEMFSEQSISTNAIYEKVENILNYDNEDLSFVTSYTWDGAIAESSHITSIGNVIYTVYPMWLILTSIILLLAMVGSIVITIKQ